MEKVAKEALRRAAEKFKRIVKGKSPVQTLDFTKLSPKQKVNLGKQLQKTSSFSDDFYQFGYDMEKKAGVPAELVGTAFNPLSAALALPAGVAGLVVGEDDIRDIPNTNMSSLGSLLIPGLGPYRLGKRLHWMLDEQDRSAGRM